MRSGRAISVVLSVVTIGALAHAQPAREAPRRDAGYIGKDIPDLEIDDCRPNDPSLTPDQLRTVASEHYQRGETLYVQGDYDGAVTELVAAYCAVPYYVVLKDIGQAYERSLEYEQAIGYLERYVASIPADAKRPTQCAPDPQDDKANVGRRVAVLQTLASRVQVETTPPGATITIANEAGRAALASSGDQIEIAGGTYELTVELAGHESVTRSLEVKIGKPYTYYVKLEPLKGTLSVQVTPPDARVFLGDRFVGIGQYTEDLAAGEYELIAEAPDRQRLVRTVEVIPRQTRRELIELAPVPKLGRRQLIVAGAVGGGLAAAGLLYAFQDSEISGAGGALGAAAGLFGGLFALPRDVTLGTSNLTITSAVAGSIAGFAGARVFSDRNEVSRPAAGASLLLGGAVGYYVGRTRDVTPGAAALFNTAVLWGTATGGLFATSFDPPRAINAGLVLSGLGMGTISGVLLTRYFTISRTHAVLIDIGGVAGIIGGLAAESLAYPTATSGPRQAARAANFALGGMAIGLVTAGVLTRNMDVPSLSVQPTLGTATGPDGSSTATYGVGGVW